MRYDISVREKVRELRQNGKTLDQIRKETLLPRTTIHGWIKDIVLSEKQKNQIIDNALASLQNGRRHVQELQQARLIEVGKKGKDLVGILTDRELFIAGIALYWAEGFKSKSENRLGFCNSDPQMVRFYIRWLKECLHVANNEIVARLSLNISYKHKITAIEHYWIEATGISKKQFTKPFYQTALWKKKYTTDRYYGVLRIHVKKSSKKLALIKGLLEGLKANNV